MSKSNQLGVQSYCFRHFKDNAVVAKKVRDLGLSNIEVCSIHADFDKPAKFGEVVSIYQNEGISIVSLGVQTFQGNDTEKNWFECAARAGAKHISGHLTFRTYLQAIPALRQWTQEYGIHVGLHCHGGYMFGGQPDVLEYLLELGGPGIGVCLDTAWAMQIGPHLGNPVAWAKKFAGRIYGVHFKDFVFGPNAQWKDVVVGTGTLDLPAFVQALEEGGYPEMTVIEYEADPENPDAALKHCAESMRKVL